MYGLCRGRARLPMACKSTLKHSRSYYHIDCIRHPRGGGGRNDFFPSISKRPLNGHWGLNTQHLLCSNDSICLLSSACCHTLILSREQSACNWMKKKIGELEHRFQPSLATALNAFALIVVEIEERNAGMHHIIVVEKNPTV